MLNFIFIAVPSVFSYACLLVVHCHAIRSSAQCSNGESRHHVQIQDDAKQTAGTLDLYLRHASIQGYYSGVLDVG